MVDVKLDVGGSPAFKAASKKNSDTGICGVLMYLLLIGAIAFLALDAAEFISLGIVKDVMGLKVMKTEEFTNMTAALEATKKQLAEKEHLLPVVTGERDGLKSQVTQLTTERDNFKNEADNKQNEINTLTGERDTLKKQFEDLTVERDALKKQIEEATVEKKAEAEVKGDAAKTEDAAGRV